MIGGAKGIGIGIDFGIPNQYCRATSEPYIEKDVLNSLRVVASAYGKSNNDADRSIVKNLVDASNPFIISNAAFKLNSGFGKYSADFESFDWAVNISQKQHNKATISLNGRLCNHTAIEVDEMKVNIIGNVTELIYWYIANPDDTTRSEIRLTSGINTLPKSYAKDDGQTYNIGFAYISGDSEITIEQIPSFEGAFVTDGIDDLIKSTKSATEMLDGSNEVTVVSMIHQIKTNDDTTRNNWFFTPVSYLGNRVVKDKIGKTGIYGYTSTNVTNAQISDITPILGDKNDYTLYSKIEDGDRDYFTVEGFQNQEIWYVSSIAWYWTIIANKVLTTDQINQVIAYFNLDRTLKPDILCNTIKQGITNENHAEFGDKLIDFSGNGRDIQLNNLAWDGDSGIGKYNYPNWKVNVTQGNKYARIVYYDSINGTYSADFKGMTDLYKSYGLSVEIRVNRANTIDYHSIKEDGIYTVTPPDDTTSIDIRFGGENVYNASCDITITQIPSHAGGLCLDGVNDFGKVTGMPVYKDYTVVADREIETINGGVLSKSYVADNGSFIFEQYHLEQDSTSSFGYTKLPIDNLNRDRKISYQSKYSYNGTSLSVGTGIDGSNMWLATIRDNDSRFSNIAIYSLMSFPYSMSEFLIERQLKKHKLGTLYPDMVEFRPVIKSNVELATKLTFVIRGTSTLLNAGDYIPKDSELWVVITMNNLVDELTKFSINGKEITIPSSAYNPATGKYGFPFVIDGKSPQKINITIDEYIRFEDIVQPYPVLLRFNNENGKEVSWGGKFRVGSTITRIGYAADSNLLPNIYNISGLSLNDNRVTSPKVVVEKTMVFKTKNTYIFDNNEPNCILSPRLLRIPNSSYKILGHIPDISGHRNHGKINNSAYAGMSGANGYTEQTFSNWRYNTAGKRAEFTISNDVKLKIAKVIMARGAILYTLIGDYTTTNSIQRYKVTGVDKNHPIVFGNDAPFDALLTVTTDGEYEVDWKTYGKNPCIFTTWTGNCNITIEQIGEYEGAYCLDGVDDFVTIPTLSHGGKQVLMKVNWWGVDDGVIYDQRNGTTAGVSNQLCFSLYPDSIAYQFRNVGGKTFIDGILNNNIVTQNLKGITHNITSITNYDINNSSTPFIGADAYSNKSYVPTALYDFMLFDEISTDDKIKELNEHVGIEGNVWGILTQLSNSTLISNETLIKNE